MLTIKINKPDQNNHHRRTRNFSKKKIKYNNYVHNYYLPLKRSKAISFRNWCFELNLVVLSNSGKSDECNFYYFAIISSLRKAWLSFVKTWNPFFKALIFCVKSGWNWPSSFGEEKINIVKSLWQLMTDKLIGKAHDGITASAIKPSLEPTFNYTLFCHGQRHKA